MTTYISLIRHCKLSILLGATLYMLLTIRRQDAADALPHADRSADRSIAQPRIEGYNGITAVAPLQEANNV
ncbi:uncharacterized protein TrAFT101_008699 [Trichoderma asperellum]|uniref:uncharacterized protein n=1 Tax=Trichoderma asperellum TaxID=101201 RepID=UPI0033230088|nr:hypothetical protein TrAFT101_008699 [Trichoderma asperellum]